MNLTPAQVEQRRAAGRASRGNQFGPYRPLADRAWSRVDKGGDCWTWTGRRGAKGYGAITVDGHERLAHRVIWELVNGPIPDGAFLLHRCDNPPCVRPSHLYVGDNAANMRDAYARHRRPDISGQRNPNVKLTPESVAEIRRAHAAGEAGHRPLAARYGVSRAAVQRIVRGLAW